MSGDNLVSIVMGGLTIIGFMIAINTHGRIRMVFSYVLATILLLGTTVVFIHSIDMHRAIKKEEAKRSFSEGKKTEIGPLQTPKRQPNLARERYAGELKNIVAHGTECANSLLNKDLRDESVELETLVGRASEMVKRVETIKHEFEKSSPTDAFFKEPYLTIKDGVQLLVEASQSYIQYYYSEDSSQEQTREYLLRLKARNAAEKFQKAGSFLAGVVK